MADDFPVTIPPPNDHGGYQDYDPFIENTFQSGDEQVLPQFTKPREEAFPLTWSKMLKVHADTLKAHYDSARGDTFNWTAPDDGVTYTCRYVGGSLNRKPLAKYPGRYRVSVQMKRIL